MATTEVVTPRKKAKQARSQATIEAILQATAQILIHDGIDAASTNRIAEKAGVSVGSLYQYFPSKEAVIFALVERHVQRMQKQLEDHVEKFVGAPLEEVVPAYVKAMFEVHRVEPKLHRVFQEQLPRLAGREEFQRWSENSEGIVRAYLEGHRDELRPTDLDLAAFLLVHSVEAVIHAVAILKPRYLARSVLAEEVSQLVLRYLLDPTARRSPRRPA
jgi:AcrR family transcriptional regulator